MSVLLAPEWPALPPLSRPIGTNRHAWECRSGESVSLSWPSKRRVESISLIVDSGLHLNVAMSYHQKDDQRTSLPPMLARTLRIETMTGKSWEPVASIPGNCLRLLRTPVGRDAKAVRVTVERPWEGDVSAIQAMRVD